MINEAKILVTLEALKTEVLTLTKDVDELFYDIAMNELNNKGTYPPTESENIFKAIKRIDSLQDTCRLTENDIGHMKDSLVLFC